MASFTNSAKVPGALLFGGAPTARYGAGPGGCDQPMGWLTNPWPLCRFAHFLCFPNQIMCLCRARRCSPAITGYPFPKPTNPTQGPFFDYFSVTYADIFCF
jgi:hypothetical protein